MKRNPVSAAHSWPQRRITVASWGNGLFIELRRIADGASAFLQGDDALRFGRELDRTTDAYADDDAVSQYFD